jgi:hypothetical protein
MRKWILLITENVSRRINIMSTDFIWYLCGGFFVFAFFLGGAAAIFFGYRNRQKATESLNWHQVPGKITEAEVKKDYDTDAEGFTTTTFVPEIKYQYQVGEEDFTNDRISFGGTKTYSSSKKAEEALSPYPVNGSVSVFYNPESPEESVLVQGTKGTMTLIIVGAVFIAISICAACIGGFLILSNL